MKILYTGYYRELSDWGILTVNNILALEKQGFDVVCRAINVGSGTETPKAIKHLEAKSIEGCEVHIQHVFPQDIVKSGRFKKTIAFLASDFFFLAHSSWVEYLRLVDEVWIPKSLNADFPQDIPHKVVPYCFDVEKYKKRYADVSIPQAEGKFKVYSKFSGQEEYKNVLRAFHGTFDTTDPVELLTLVDNENNMQKLDAMSSEVKAELRIQSSPDLYKKEIIVPLHRGVEPERIHQYADCFVSTQSAPSVSVLDFDAMAFGNKPIVANNNSGMEYFEDCCTPVNSVFKSYKQKQSMFGDMCNGKDFLLDPCELGLRKAMSVAFSQHKENPIMYKAQNKSNSLIQAEKFSIENSKIGEALNV